MTRLLRFLAPGLVAAGLAGTAAAQTADTSGSTTSNGNGGTSVSGLSGGSGPSAAGSGAFGTGTNNATPITISPPSAVQTTNVMSATNILGRYYANPMYQGAATATGSTLTTVVNPGGFNAPTYGNTSTGGGSSRTGSGTTASTGFTGSTGTTGRTGGATGTTGFGAATTGSTTGFGGATTNRAGGTNTLGTSGGGVNQQNSGLISPRAINYTAVYRFPVAATPPAQMTSQLRGIVDASSMIARPKDVQIVTEAGGLVILRGTVADDDEARTVEGMLRLTPGVREVKNELTYPAAPVPVAAN